MNNLFPINAPLTVVWHLSKPDGSDFNLYGYDYRLYYKSGKGKTEVASTAVTADGNTISFVFPATAQRFPGGYSLQLVLYQNGKIFCDLNYNNAFFFSRFDSAPQPSQNQEADGRIVHLYTVAEYYLLSPVIPVVGPDGYWYVNGTKVTDGNGEYVPSSHTVVYDSATNNIIIDQGRVDSHGNSIAQTITSLADALASQESRYTAAEGSASTSVAGDGSRWGAFKAAEAVREENETARKNAEGTSSDVAGTDTRWGAEKQRQINETGRIATEGRMQGLIDNIVVNFLADTDVYEQAVEQGFEGSREEWLASTLGVKGRGIESWVINQSTADSGTTTHTITLNDDNVPGGPTVYTFTVKNGKGISSITTVPSIVDGGANAVTITMSDGTSKSFNILNGSGIASITTNTSHVDGGANTITITTSDGRVTTMTVYNGNQGSSAAPNPDEVAIVNDRTTGGTTSAWSAEQGKLLCAETLFLGTVVETLS